MSRDDLAWRRLMLGVLIALLLWPGTAECQLVDFSGGEYTLSTPATIHRPPDKLAPEVGRAMVERLLKPEHMLMTGLGESGNATLRVGDATRAELFALLGPAKVLPYGLQNVRRYGYVSNRPGDSTLVVVGMGNTVLDNPNYVVSIDVCFSPAALSKDYRRALKSFVPSAGVHAGLATQSGLRLGLTRQEVEAILGEPIWKDKDSYHYGVVADMALPAELLINRWNWPKDSRSRPGGVDQHMTFWFVGGRVSAFHVRKLYDM